jgi:hypothetical protein
MTDYHIINQTKAGFAALDVANNLKIFGILLQDMSVFFDEVFLKGVNVSIKHVALDDNDVLLGRAVVFQLDQTIAEFENVDFFCNSLMESSIDGIEEKEVHRAIYIINRILKSGADLVGLIGELLFILKEIKMLKNPEIIYAWHNEIDDNFDFVLMDAIYEVKTTRLAVRKHMIKYQQHELLLNDIRPNRYYASVLLVQRKVDNDINGLLQLIFDNISDHQELLDNFKSKINQYGDLIRRSQFKFDVNDSLASIELFHVDHVGKIDVVNDFIEKNDLLIPVYLRR